jgi:hypothetical protein
MAAALLGRPNSPLCSGTVPRSAREGKSEPPADDRLA